MSISTELRSPVDLAITRVVVFLLLAGLCIHASPIWMAGLPRDLLYPPPGTGWLVLLLDQQAVRVATVALFVCAVLAAAGLWYRVTAPLAVLLGLYVLGVPQLWGKVNHYHHVLWFAAILAFSPAADALAISRQLRPAPSLTYARPLEGIAVLIGLCYFFPGFHKAMTPGWAWSDNLQYQIWGKWTEVPGFVPLFTLDGHPTLLRLLALATIAFELSFLPLVFIPRIRPWLVLAGLGFHLGTAAVMGINFWVLWVCYVALLPWGRWLRVKGAAPTPLPRRAPLAVTWGWASLILLCEAASIDSWPVGTYPAFAFIAGPTRGWMDTAFLDAKGQPVPVPPDAELRIIGQMGGSRWAAILSRAATHPDPAIREGTARGVVDLLAREAPQAAAAASMRLTWETRYVEPWRRGQVEGRVSVAVLPLITAR